MASGHSRMEIAKQLFDSATIDYMERKHRGGISGKKGTRYEDRFAAAKVAQLASRYLGHAPADWPTVKEQVHAAFVDDVVVCETDTTAHHQCKDVKSISWSGGDHPICVDFEKQLELCEAANDPNPVMHLVVSDVHNADALRAALPHALVGKTEVNHFPAIASVNALIQDHDELKSWLSLLTRVEEPSLDEMEVAFKAILSAWIHLKDEGSLFDLMVSAGKQSPRLLRAFPSSGVPGSIPPELIDALAGVPGLKYDVKRGVFEWYDPSMRTRAIFPEDCESEEFKRFVRRIAKNPPACFEDLWEAWP